MQPPAKRLLTSGYECAGYVHSQVWNIRRLKSVMGSSTHLRESILSNRSTKAIL